MNAIDIIKDIYDNTIKSMEDLIKKLNYYTEAYDKGQPLISDTEWDKIYFELVELEENTGIYLPESPTQKIHFIKVSELAKKTHDHLMLSLEKTKSEDMVKAFFGDKKYLAMCKMDGLTCSLTYEGGRLVGAETRGDGKVGEDVLHNAMVIPSIPKSISYKNKLVVDGEIICATDDFEKFSNEYENPRNFAAGSIRLLDSIECARRDLTFVAWNVIEGFNDKQTLDERLRELYFYQFTVVPYTAGSISDCIKYLKEIAEFNHYPIDGIVFKYNDIEYGRSLGATSHHFKDAIAFKFEDESYPSILRHIDWTMGRSGSLTPVAIFDPIEIEGSTVERASLHNISIMEALSGGFERIGDTVYVFKSNQIIPQISEWEHNGDYDEECQLLIPKVCPYCGQPTEVRKDIDSKVLYCTNSNCEGKLINVLDHFCSKKGLDIKGLSKATLEKLIEWGWVNDITDIFTLKDHRAEWIQKTGFGVKSVDKVLAAVEVSRSCDLQQFICALGIPLIGATASAELAKVFPSWADFINAIHNNEYYFSTLQNFGDEMHYSLKTFDYTLANYIINNNLVNINNTNIDNNNNNIDNNKLSNITFVITGKLVKFRNRDEITNVITSLGGKVTGSVSKNTDYLINNDIESTSSKNRTAKSLGIPILTEENFIEKFSINT